MTQQINQPLANVISRCIANSPDSETKRREVAKLKAMFSDRKVADIEKQRRLELELYGNAK